LTEAFYPKTISFRAPLMPFMRIACPIPHPGDQYRKRHPHNDMGWKEVSGVFSGFDLAHQDTVAR